MRILLASHESLPMEELIQLLTGQGHSVHLVSNGKEALDTVLEERFDVFLESDPFPQGDVLVHAPVLKNRLIHLPTLVLSQISDPERKAKVLNSGADDYMTLPYHPGELLARIYALDRRGGLGRQQGEFLLFGDLQLDLFTRELKQGDRSVRLGFKEFDVLRLMITSARILSKEDLLSRVWGQEDSCDDNNVEAYISFLRKKLFLLKSRVSIATQRRRGYYLVDNESPCI